MLTVSNFDAVSFKLKAKCGEHRAFDSSYSICQYHYSSSPLEIGNTFSLLWFLQWKWIMIQHCHLVSTFMSGLLTHSLISCALSDTELRLFWAARSEQSLGKDTTTGSGLPSVANWWGLEELTRVKLFYTYLDFVDSSDTHGWTYQGLGQHFVCPSTAILACTCPYEMIVVGKGNNHL